MANRSLKAAILLGLSAGIAWFSVGAVTADPPSTTEADRLGCYYVAGGVRHPGVYKLSAKGVSLKQAVVAAGIDVENGSLPVVLIHLVGEGGQQNLKLNEVLDSKASPPIRVGDVIEIGKSEQRQ